MSERKHPDRRTFLKEVSALALGTMVSPLLSHAAGNSFHRNEMINSAAIKEGKAEIATILHTSDIHAQLFTHDEFFVENGQVVYKKRGGLAVLKTMINQLRSENPSNTILIDGGDCFQGGGLAALTKGKAIIPMINDLGYNLVIPGNWEVVYKKEMMLADLGEYKAMKICANMFHQTDDINNGKLIFPPWWTTTLAGIKMGFIGYTDPKIPKRQPPAYSQGLQFNNPVESIAEYITILKQREKCAMVFVVSHLGLAQQVDMANSPEVQGVDYILGGDTHERVRRPLQGKYTKVTEPGAFGSFLARLDLVVEDGIVKDQHYELLEVDPEKYKADNSMNALIRKESAPYQKQLDTVIGSSGVSLVRYYVIENTMDNLITDAMMWKFKVDIALSNGFRFCPPLIPDKKTNLAPITVDYLYSMLPVDSEIKSAQVRGKELWEWLERELHNVFAKSPAERFGGWMVRMNGMQINFTVNKEVGHRLNWIKINNEPIVPEKLYTIVACEREGDPDDTLCRMEKVSNPKLLGTSMHKVMTEYLKAKSPVSPRIEGRVTATDAPPTLLSQLEGYGYEFY